MPADVPPSLHPGDTVKAQLMDADDVRWTSRDVMSRAWKLEHLFDWELLGAIELDDGFRAAAYRLLTPP